MTGSNGSDHLQCPYCDAIFRVPGGDERIGDVRCGNCAGVFHGDDCLVAGTAPRDSEPAGGVAPDTNHPATEDESTPRGAAPVAGADATDPSAATPHDPDSALAAEAADTLDLSHEAADFFITENLAPEEPSGASASQPRTDSLDEDLPGMEETIVMVAPVPLPTDAPDEPAQESPDEEPPPETASPDEASPDDLLGDVLADLPDAEATLALTDPLLEDAEDSVESIDLSETTGIFDEQPDLPLPQEEDEQPAPDDAATLPLADLDETDAVATLSAAMPQEPADVEQEATLQLSADEVASLLLDEDPDATHDAGPVAEDLPPASTAPAAALDTPQAEQGTQTPPPSTTDPDTGDDLPRAGPSLTAFVGWSVAALVLLLLGAAQLVYATRGSLQDNPIYRPYVERLCVIAGCELPPLRDLSRIAIFGRHVESHPGFRDALLVNASIVNQAPFAQPYPRILLRFSDAQGASYAERVFLPEEYLRQPLVDPDRFVSEVPVKFSLELLDPGPGAVRYDFKFL